MTDQTLSDDNLKDYEPRKMSDDGYNNSERIGFSFGPYDMLRLDLSTDIAIQTPRFKDVSVEISGGQIKLKNNFASVTLPNYFGLPDNQKATREDFGLNAKIPLGTFVSAEVGATTYGQLNLGLSIVPAVSIKDFSVKLPFEAGGTTSFNAPNAILEQSMKLRIASVTVIGKARVNYDDVGTRATANDFYSTFQELVFSQNPLAY